VRLSALCNECDHVDILQLAQYSRVHGPYSPYVVPYVLKVNILINTQGKLMHRL